MEIYFLHKNKGFQHLFPFTFLELIFSRFLFYSFLGGSFVPVIFNEVDNIFFGPIPLIGHCLSTGRSEEHGWVTLDFKSVTWNIICGCILPKQKRKNQTNKQKSPIKNIVLYQNI